MACFSMIHGNNSNKWCLQGSATDSLFKRETRLCHVSQHNKFLLRASPIFSSTFLSSGCNSNSFTLCDVTCEDLFLGWFFWRPRSSNSTTGPLQTPLLLILSQRLSLIWSSCIPTRNNWGEGLVTQLFLHHDGAVQHLSCHRCLPRLLLHLHVTLKDGLGQSDRFVDEKRGLRFVGSELDPSIFIVLKLMFPLNQLNGLVVEWPPSPRKLGSCYFNSQLGYTKDYKNCTHHLPAWHSIFGVGLEGLDRRMFAAP